MYSNLFLLPHLLFSIKGYNIQDWVFIIRQLASSSFSAILVRTDHHSPVLPAYRGITLFY